MIFGYARCSTSDQHLGPQIAQLTIAGCSEISQEKASGAKDDRPELLALLGKLVDGDILVVAKLDRLARSTAHLLKIVDDLDARGVALKILNMNLDTSTPTGRLMLTVVGAIAEFERALMLERQRDGIARAKQEGKYKGRKPSVDQYAEQILQMLSAGRTRNQVAKKLGIGVSAVYRIAPR